MMVNHNCRGWRALCLHTMISWTSVAAAIVELEPLTPANVNTECSYEYPFAQQACEGLNSFTARNASACAEECCSDDRCVTWAFSNKQLPAGGCWLGECQNPLHSFADFSGASKTRPFCNQTGAPLAFPINNFQCLGLEQLTSATSATECEDACCKGNCSTWEFSAGARGGCWMGDVACAGSASPGWTGKSRVKTPLPPPPPAPDIPFTLPRLTPQPLTVDGIADPILSLNGVWEFFAGFANSTWQPIVVPGEYTLQGHDIPVSQVVQYKKIIQLPSDWTTGSSLRIKIKADGISSLATVMVNGDIVGTHLGGFTPFEFDLTNLMHAGNNTFLINVTGYSLADGLASASKYAVHDLGGITRKIRLFAIPEMSVSDVHVVSTFTDTTYTNARLSVNVTMANDADVSQPVTTVNVSLCVRTLATQSQGCDPLSVVATAVLNFYEVATNTLAAGVVVFNLTNPFKWDPEHPNLYILQVNTKCGCDDRNQITLVRVGIRQIEVVGNRVILNGVPVKARGTTRHETHPTFGRSLWNVPPVGKQWERDVMVFRDININYFRTSHYPPAEELMEAADELGMMIELEMPFCWASGNVGEIALQYTIQAQVESALFNRNHASVIAWSLGNESPWLSNFNTSYYDHVIKVDSTRPFMFDGGRGQTFKSQGGALDIATAHYPGLSYDWSANLTYPVSFGEYAHLSCYNRQELLADPGLRTVWAKGVEEMWEKVYATDGVLGACYWAGIDDQFYVPQHDNRLVGYGPWGVIDGWRRYKPESHAVKQIYSPVKLLHLSPCKTNAHQFCVADIATIVVENRHDFTDLSELNFSWSSIEGDVNHTGVGIATGAPRSKNGSVKLQNLNGVTAVELTVTSPRGFLINTWRVYTEMANSNNDKATTRTNTKQNKNSLSSSPSSSSSSLSSSSSSSSSLLQVSHRPSTPPALDVGVDAGVGVGVAVGVGVVVDADVRVGVSDIIIKAGDITWTVRGVTGMLTGTRGATLVVSSGPKLMMLALDSQDQLMQLTLDTDESFLPSTAWLDGWSLSSINQTALPNNGHQVTVSGTYAGSARGVFVLTFDALGALNIDFNFTWTSTSPIKPRQVGVVMDVSGDHDRLSWLRQTQYSYYTEDDIGRGVGTDVRASPCSDMYRGCPHFQNTPSINNTYAVDSNPLGTNDFRSTKPNVTTYELCSSGVGSSSSCLLINTTASPHTDEVHCRSWVNTSASVVHVLSAVLTNEGANPFSRESVLPHPSYAAGSIIAGTVGSFEIH